MRLESLFVELNSDDSYYSLSDHKRENTEISIFSMGKLSESEKSVLHGKISARLAHDYVIDNSLLQKDRNIKFSPELFSENAPQLYFLDYLTQGNNTFPFTPDKCNNSKLASHFFC